MDSNPELKKEGTEAVTEEPTKESTAKVENDEENQGAEEASGSSWWGMDYSSLLNKAVSSVSKATTAAALNAAELAKQKSTEVYGHAKKISKRGSLLKVRSGCYNYRFKLYK